MEHFGAVVQRHQPEVLRWRSEFTHSHTHTLTHSHTLTLTLTHSAGSVLRPPWSTLVRSSSVISPKYCGSEAGSYLRLLYHSTPGLRVIQKKKYCVGEQRSGCCRV